MSGGNAVGNWSLTKDYIYRDGQLLAHVTGGGSTVHYTLDHLGSPRLLTNGTGGYLSDHHYYGFGQELAPSTTDPMKFTGHERDFNASGGTVDDLDYMHARYYSAHLGRFLSIDPAMQAERAMGTPQLWNRYSYSLNSPVSYYDPTGQVVNLASLEEADRKKLLKQLSAKTGLILRFDSSSGNLVVGGVVQTASGASIGSSTARSDILSAVASETTFHAISRNGSDAVNMGRRRGPHLELDFSDIAEINPGKNDPATLDAAMIFLHELKHAQGLQDPEFGIIRRNRQVRGDAVNHMNKIRRELGLELRGQYATESAKDGRHFLPFTRGPIYVPGKVD